MKEKNPIQLRKKPLKNGGYSLYLDMNINGKRTYEFLKMYLNPGTDAATKSNNKRALEAAKVIVAKRLTQILANKAEIITLANKRILLRDFCEDFLKEQQGFYSENYSRHLRDSVRYFEDFHPGMAIKDITPAIIIEFIRYLRNVDVRHFTKKVYRHDRFVTPLSEERVSLILKLQRQGMSQQKIADSLDMPKGSVSSIIRRSKRKEEPRTLCENTVRSYYCAINKLLYEAKRRGLIATVPTDMLSDADKPKTREKERAYLTIDEIRILKDTPFIFPTAKLMFLFGCFTGLRFSDIRRVTWKNIDEGKVSLVMQKTKRVVVVPLSANALSVLPERGDSGKDDLVFKDYPSLSLINVKLHQWVKKAGIHKEISFHCSRHTFATVLLTCGVDLYTVSKLLGHTNIATTQIYAKIIDQKKEDAVNALPKL